MLSTEEIKALAEIDSPTVSNAIEAFQVRDATNGYASMSLHCLYPDLGPMVGYAVTCTSDTTSPAPRRPTKEAKLFEVVQAAPKPVVVVIKDVSPNLVRSCHAGDVLCSIFQRLGAVGMVTDGGIRDSNAIRERVPGFQVFAGGFVVSHGIPTFVEIGCTVSICGLTVKPGDLLHGDENGLLTIPPEVSDRIAEQAHGIWEKERDLLDFVRSEAFSLEALKGRMQH
jgi:regulator of RNase E activity RraA